MISIGDALLKIGVDTKNIDKGMKGLQGNIQKHKKQIGMAMVAMAGTVVAASTVAIKQFAAMGDEVQKMALRTGFSTEALSELRHAAEIGGTSLSSVEKAVKRMSGTILDAQDGLETYVRAFRHIGIEVEQFQGLNPEQQFLLIADALGKVEDATKKAAIAQDIFGRAGTEILPMLTGDLKDLREEAHKLGIVFDQEAADSAANLNDELTRLDASLKSLKFAFAKEMAPAVTSFITSLGQFIRGDELVFFGQRAHALNNIIELSAKAASENEKAQAGQENQLRATVVALREAYDVWWRVREQTLENNEIMSAAVSTLDEWIAKADAMQVVGEELNAVIEQTPEELEAAEKAMEAYAESIEDLRDRTLELWQAQRLAAANRVAGLATIAGQIEAAGGQISASRAAQYYYELNKMSFRQKHGMTPTGPGEAPAFAAGTRGGRGPIHIHVDLNGREIAEAVTGPLGEMTEESGEMEGG